MKFRNVISAFLATALVLPSHAAPSKQRPPQFVLLSFDGSKSIPFWQETKAFAGKFKIGFTYFMSGVYFLNGESQQEKLRYEGPGHKPGRSDIGFGKDREDIKGRIDQVLDAADRRMELGSHANGHFDGSKWDYLAWLSEFSQFSFFIKDVFSINKINDSSRQNQWIEKVSSQIRGFRAPLLGVNKDMYTALKSSGYTYDTSGISDPRRWPTRNKEGMWLFPLQSIRLAGTGKLTITMDYNILVSQCNNQFAEGSGGGLCKNSTPESFQKYEDETYETYVQLFKQNYFGNRAPIVIGHHFSLWNKGAYWKALQRFASDICNLEEVRCVTYGDLVNWLETEKAQNIGAYQQGRFPMMAKKDLGLAIEHLSTFHLEADLRMKEQGEIVAKIRGRDAQKIQEHPEVYYEWQVDGVTRQTDFGKPRIYRPTAEDLADGKVFTLLVRKREKELLGEVRTLRRNDENQIAPWLENTGWQERLLKGDLPEAHNETDDEELIKAARVK